jgi:hypothetical protein
MRLIDAEDVKKLLVARYENSELIMKDVDRIPTAYDLDEVVEKLEFAEFKCQKIIDSETSITKVFSVYVNRKHGLQEAINIVKRSTSHNEYDKKININANTVKKFDQVEFDREATNPNNGYSDRERNSYGNNN